MKKQMKKYYLAYEYESAYGTPIRKLVICEGWPEYRRIEDKIYEAGYKIIPFDAVFSSKKISND